MGSKNRPSYRFVVADSRERRDGAFVEMIGHYDPLTEPETVSVNQESLFKWMDRGAQMSETVRSLLKKKGILDRSGRRPAAPAPVAAEAAPAPAEPAPAEPAPEPETPASQE
jgi:small subunit ribosomal protein S16